MFRTALSKKITFEGIWDRKVNVNNRSKLLKSSDTAIDMHTLKSLDIKHSKVSIMPAVNL